MALTPDNLAPKGLTSSDGAAGPTLGGEVGNSHLAVGSAPDFSKEEVMELRARVEHLEHRIYVLENKTKENPSE